MAARRTEPDGAEGSTRSDVPTETEHGAIVIGAGMSGLVSASILLEQGVSDILVVDEYDHVGGNHLDVAIGDYTYDVGSFIFQDDSPLLRHFPELLSGYQTIDPSWARLNPQGVVTKYPFSLRDDVLAAGPVEILRIVASALVARVDRRPQRNARDYVRHWVGARFLRRTGLEHYMARFCGVPIDQIDLAFAQNRMVWLPEKASLGGVVRRVRDRLVQIVRSIPGNRQLARPREGFAALYAPAVERLEERGVTFSLGDRLVGVTRSDPGSDEGGFEVRTDSALHRAPRLISTIPVGRIRELAGHSLAEPLPSVTLVSLFYSFSGERGFRDPILYNFSHTAAWKRLTVYSDFYGVVGGREYFTVEVIGGAGAPQVEEAAAEFRAHTAQNDLLVGDLRLEGSHVLSQAYPIYTAGSAGRAAQAVQEMRELGIESFGRQGAFQYQPTARVSTLEAEAALRAM